MTPDTSHDPHWAGTAKAACAPKDTTLTSRADHIIERIRAIPEGRVRTYADIEPRAPRLVGRVLQAHHTSGVEPPNGVGIPWHRVVRSDGSVAGGAPQLALLRREGVPILRGRVDMRHTRIPAEGDHPRPRTTR